jgi:hypothetical protein
MRMLFAERSDDALPVPKSQGPKRLSGLSIKILSRVIPLAVAQRYRFYSYADCMLIL